MATLRFLVATVVVSPIIWRYWPRGLAWWKIVVLSCGPGVPYVLFAFLGMKFAPASHAGILMNGTLPILAALIGWSWLKDAPTRWKAFGMGIILCGSLLIGWDRTSVGVGPEAWIGHLCFLASAGLMAAYMAAAKVWRLAPMQALASIPLVNLAWFGPVYLIFLPKAIDRAEWSEILFQGLYQGLGPGILGGARCGCRHGNSRHR
jgi:drug/metabolite transporter (DMT)-like permease